MSRFNPLRLAALTLAALAVTTSGCFGSSCEYDPDDKVTVGASGELDFYYQCISSKCAIDAGREMPADPETPLGSTHVIFVEAHGSPGEVMPSYVFESENTGVFEVLEVGCNGTCGIFSCDYETECDAPYVYHVSLRPTAPGSTRLLVYDLEGALVDAATVTIRPAADAGADG